MTELTITEDTTVGTIAELLPGATEVFRRAGIGFCCGGNEPLAQAVAHQGGDLAGIMADLQALIARTANRPPEEMGVATNRVQAGRPFVFPQGEEGWLGFGKGEPSSKLTLVFSPRQLTQPEFFSARQVRVLTPAEQKALGDLRKSGQAEFAQTATGGVVTAATDKLVVVEIVAQQKLSGS